MMLNWSRERVKILDNLNSVLQNSKSTVNEIEEAEKKLTEFDEEDIRQILLKNENFRMFEDERYSKIFLTLENSKSTYNNVSHLTVEEEIIDDSTSPQQKTKIPLQPLNPKKFLRNLLVNSNQFIIFSLTLTDLKIIS